MLPPTSFTRYLKPIVFGVVCLLASVSPASAQFTKWEKQNPTGFMQNLYDIQIVSPTTAYAVGSNNSFLVFSDTGNQITIYSPAVPLTSYIGDNFYSLSFINEKIGVVAGTNGVLKTTNGGITWATLTSARTAPCYSSKVLMLDRSLLFLVVDNHFFFRSTDGGNTWETLFDESFGSIQVLKELPGKGVVIGYNSTAGSAIACSTNNGKSWIHHSTGKGYLRDLDFKDSVNGKALLGISDIITTTDQGRTWSVPFTWDTVQMYGTVMGSAIRWHRSGAATMVGDFNNVFYADSGVGWERGTPLPWLSPPIEYRSLSQYSSTFAMAAGRKGTVIRTLDGGRTWKLLTEIPLDHQFRDIAFPKGDTLHGIVIGAWGGVIVKTDDGGKHWVEVTPRKKNDHPLNAIAFRDSMTAFVVGDYGAILKTTDRGDTWDTIRTEITTTMNGICFSSPTTGWIVGNAGLLAYTTDAGASWKKKKIFPTDTIAFAFLDVSFCDKDHGMIVGLNDLVVARITTDGGNTWNIVDMGPNKPPMNGQHCVMLSPNHWSISRDSAVFTYVNDSLHIFPPTYHYDPFNHVGPPVDISYGDSLNCIITRDSVLRSFSGGTSFLYDVRIKALAATCPTPTYSWICGDGGIIYKGITENPFASVPIHNPAAQRPFSIRALFPNPASTQLTVHYHSDESATMTITIYSILGEQLLQQYAMGYGNGDHTQSLDVQRLAAGTYILELSNGYTSETQSFIVRH